MKRYYYNGKEISKRKADLIFVGALAGMIAAAFGTWACMCCLITIGSIIGA